MMKSMIIKMKTKHDTKETRQEKKNELYRKSTSIVNPRHKNQIMDNHLFRAEVELDKSKLAEDQRLVDEYELSSHYKLMRSVMFEYSKRKKSDRKLNASNIESTSSLNEESHYVEKYKKSPKYTLTQILKQKDSVEFTRADGSTIRATLDDLNRYSEFLRTRERLNKFRNLQAWLQSDNILPINFITEKYIKFDKNSTLISFRFDASSEERYRVAISLITKFKTILANKRIDIVHYRVNSTFITLNILCDNEKYESILKGFLNLYEQREDFHIEENFNLDFSVSRNIGEDFETYSMYYIFSGKAYDDLKDEYRLTDEPLVGYDVLG